MRILLICIIFFSSLKVNSQTKVDFYSNYDSKLLKIVDILGRETYPHSNMPLFYIYNNGRVKKIIRK